MKNNFIPALLLLLATAAGAQPAGKAMPSKAHMQALSAMLQQNSSLQPAAKATATTIERLVAQSTRDNTLGSLADSLNLRYTGLRNSKYDYNTMLYAYNYPYSTSPMFNFLGVFTTPQVQYDTCLRFTINPFTNVYGPYEASFATYDTHSNLTAYRDIFVDSADNDNMSYANTFNTNNDIAKGYWFNLNAGVADSAFRQLFEYNTATHKLVKDSLYELHLGVWRIVSKTTYTYDASGNLITADQFSNAADTSYLLPLVETQKYVNTYDASNRLLTVGTSLYNGTALAASARDTFAYSGTLAYYSSWREHQYDPINGYWAPMIKVEKHIAGTRPDTVNTYGFDSLLNSWVPQQMDIVHYDAALNPDTMQTYMYSWTAFPATPDYTRRYYYGTYVDNTAAGSVAAEATTAIVFPNPATDAISITCAGIATGAEVTVMLLNAAGQPVVRQAMQWQQQLRIPLSGLVPGMYEVMVQHRDGAMVCRQAIIKQ